MHAVFTQVSITDYEAARKMLHSDLIPRVKGAPGFVAGWWLAPLDGKSGSGVSVEVFESEDAARGFVQQFEPVVAFVDGGSSVTTTNGSAS